MVDREKVRMEERLKTHKENDVWEPRTSPPEDWNKPLPPEIAKMAENSLFQKYTDNGGELPEEEKEGMLSALFITGHDSLFGAAKSACVIS